MNEAKQLSTQAEQLVEDAKRQECDQTLAEFLRGCSLEPCADLLYQYGVRHPDQLLYLSESTLQTLGLGEAESERLHRVLQQDRTLSVDFETELELEAIALEELRDDLIHCQLAARNLQQRILTLRAELELVTTRFEIVVPSWVGLRLNESLKTVQERRGTLQEALYEAGLYPAWLAISRCGFRDFRSLAHIVPAEIAKLGLEPVSLSRLFKLIGPYYFRSKRAPQQARIRTWRARLSPLGLDRFAVGFAVLRLTRKNTRVYHLWMMQFTDDEIESFKQGNRLDLNEVAQS